MVQCGAVDPRARNMNFDDELMGKLIRSVACHEVGHALGLLHNFGASSSTPVEVLRNKEYVEKYGFCSSIMDYARFNYVAQPEDSISQDGLISRIGPYDIWAIQWGYRFFPDIKTADEEKLKLNSWIGEKVSDSRLWFGSEFTPDDPRTQTEDLGNNAMKAGDYGIKNLQRIVPNLLEWTKREGAGYAGLSEIYSGVTSQYSNYLRHVTRYVGGVYETIKSTDQPGPTHQAVPAERQREAMQFLDKHIFQTPYWLLDTAVLTRIGTAPLQIVAHHQADVLSSLLDVNTMNELVFAESMYGKEAYSLYAFFQDLKTSVWKELELSKPVDQYRRMLQRYYVEKLIKLKSNETNTGPGYNDVIPMITAHLKTLRTNIKTSLKKVEDPMTRNHLQFLYDEINDVLPMEK
jgi:hypothetical protein